MAKNKCLAMLLAGGQGSRLLALTHSIAKPAVSFGGKYRIIDFALSNCTNSEIETVGVLTQYRPYLLHNYIGSGAAWNLDTNEGGVSILPPYATEKGGSWYAGTADAIYQNIDYIEANKPDYVLILSGDHLYSMDYQEMLNVHIQNDAALTISVMPVPWEDASRFGIITAAADGSVAKFTEKPAEPDSNLASMGIYIFSTDVLLRVLKEDAQNQESSHDFGNDIIPKLLKERARIYCYEFNGFWKDVGTLDSYYETAMMLLDENPEFDVFRPAQPIFCNAPMRPPHFVGPGAKITNSIVVNGCRVYGKVTHSIISTDAFVGEGAVVEDSILLPGAWVDKNATAKHAILGENAGLAPGISLVGKNEIALVGDNTLITEGGVI